MKTASMIGSAVVTIALVFYSIGFTKEKQRQLVTFKVLFFYTIGITLDITATIFMIIGSSSGMLTFHGFIGYSSLLGMFTDTFLLFRHYLKEGPEKNVSRQLHLYSRIAYTWWIIAYITGGLLVAIIKIYR
ncbi:MAG: hypothetical protein MUC93_06460 [Bacteroidales bacterium]|jgi:hypothetical protein|nr:hypothetical protein [Bacteroidales bacterium]